jgi:DNA-binding NtrC family response regulator
MDILKQLKALKPALPVIIVTGYQSVEMAQDAVRNGAKDYLPKPFEIMELKKVVAANLD